MSKKIKSVLLTGPPGVGKTTIVKRLVKILKIHHVNCSGFYTEDVRFENGIRIGFDVVCLDGERTIFARQFTYDNVERPMIGKFHVYVKEFEEAALPALNIVPKTLIIIDKIGQMELLSEKFKEKIQNIFGNTAIVATVPKTRIEFVEQLKENKNTVTVQISKQNRIGIVDTIFERICQMVFH